MKKTKQLISLIVLSFALVVGIGVANKVEAHDSAYVHFEFRWNSPYDQTWNQTKWTKSGYALKSTKCSRPWYSAKAYGHCSAAGRTGNVDVSNGHTYKVYPNKTYNLTNYLVERYGTGNNAWIQATSWGNGSAYGTWHADH